jgi:hypothetical protein
VAISVAGCAGSGGQPTEDEADGNTGPVAGDTTTATGDRPPAESGGSDSGTSLAGSCAAAFGDTDQEYEAASSQWVVSFAYPMGGDVIFAGSGGDDIGASIGYVPDFDGGYDHELTVVQEDGATVTVDELVAGGDWESGDSVTYDGTERAVAVQSTPDSVTMVFTIEGSEENHGIVVSVAPGVAEACPDVYATVCRRVLESMAPRA